MVLEAKVAQHNDSRKSWRQLKIRIRVEANSESGIDAECVADGLLKCWAQFQLIIHELPENEIQDMKNYFNSLDDDIEEHQFGECLTGDIGKAVFENRLENLSNNNNLEELIGQLLETGLIDKDFEI